MAKKAKTIEERNWSGRQSRNLRVLREVAGKKVRVEVKRDSYDEQSYARAAVFSPATLSWNALSGSSHLAKDVDAKLRADAETLFALAAKLLS